MNNEGFLFQLENLLGAQKKSLMFSLASINQGQIPHNCETSERVFVDIVTFEIMLGHLCNMLGRGIQYSGTF